ncbi:leucyl aminopeptidase [Streptomyces ambofaciens]
MTALTLSTAAAPGLRADAIVIGVAKGADGPSVAPGAEAVDKAYDGRLAGVLETLGASGAEGEVTKLPAPAGFKAPVVVAVGLGAEPEKDAGFDAEALRRAAGAAARALAGAKKAAFALPLAEAADAGVVAEGVLLGAYSFDAYKESAKDGKDTKGARSKGNGKAPLAEAALLGGKPRDKAFKAAVERAAAVAEELNRARDLVNTPPNDLNPEAFAAVAQAAAKEHGIKVQVLDEKALVKGGYGGILGVGAGSASGPRLVKLSYTSSKAKKSLAFVGKGITYDSGGISLKPAGHNETMKCDMAGAAAVFAAVVAAARLGLEVNVTGWLALAENMPSGSATRPGDVLRMYSGKTVEVLNTDAEGRLVLADALWAALAGEAGRDHRRGDPDGRDDAGAGQPDVRDHGERRRVPRRGARGGGGVRRAGVADAAAGAPAQGHGLADRGHREHGRADGRRSGGRSVPAGVRGRGHHLGAPGHRGSGLQRGRAVRIHAEGRYGDGRADAGAGCRADGCG